MALPRTWRDDLHRRLLRTGEERWPCHPPHDIVAEFKAALDSEQPATRTSSASCFRAILLWLPRARGIECRERVSSRDKIAQQSLRGPCVEVAGDGRAVEPRRHPA
jgi:hypothetical protein